MFNSLATGMGSNIHLNSQSSIDEEDSHATAVGDKVNIFTAKEKIHDHLHPMHRTNPMANEIISSYD